MRSAFFFWFFSCSALLFGQSVDSLLTKLQSASSDTGRINLLNKLTDVYLGDKNDSAKYFNDLSLKLSSEKNLERYNFEGVYYKGQLYKADKVHEKALAATQEAFELARLTGNVGQQARALRLAGTIYDAQNLEKEAIEKFLQALELCKAAKNKEGILASNMSLGLYFKRHNDVTNGLKYFLEANKQARELKDSSNMFTCIINLGTLYEVTNDRLKALNFYREAMVINERDNDDNGKAISTFKLGRLYYALGKRDSGKYFLKQTLAMHLKNKQERGLIFDYAFLGNGYEEEGDLKKAYENWNMALMLGKKFQDSGRVNMVYAAIAVSEFKRKNYAKALEYYKEGLKYVTSTLPKETMSALYERMAQAAEKMGQYKQAYEYQRLFKMWSDSSKNVSEARKQTELKLSSEFNEVQEKMMADADAKEKDNQEKIQKEHQQRNFLLIGLLIISVFFVLAVRSYRMKRKANDLLEMQKQEIERQKKIVELKNHEISDSINYAQRIQTASLPEPKELTQHFSKYELFFRPKDVVSGDFYWSAGKGDHAVIAIADCTGHGVPGAITSIIGSMLLNEIYYVKKLSRPDEVLKELNRLVKLTLRQETESLSKDGMDIAFCVLDKKSLTLQYAGANRPVYILRGEDLIECKPTKVSVGGYVPLLQDYDLNTIQLSEGDTVIVTTDGYADQFGGAHEKKLTTKAFKQMLRGSAAMSLHDKSRFIEASFYEWKGVHEQTDDVLLFMLQV